MEKFGLKVELTCSNNCHGCWKEIEKEIKKEIEKKVKTKSGINVNEVKREVWICGAIQLQTDIHELLVKHRLCRTAELIIQPTREDNTQLVEYTPQVVNNQVQPNSQITEDIPKSPSQSLVSLSTATRIIYSGLDMNHEHEHDLQLIDYRKPFTCDGCREQGFGNRYKCGGLCDYQLHVKCRSPQQAVNPDLLPGQKLYLLCQPPAAHAGQFCSACGKGICGIAYHCSSSAGRGLYLHPLCSDAKLKLTIGGTDYHLREKQRSSCFWCRKKEKEAPTGWSYVSDCGEFHLHLYCVTEIMGELWKRGLLEDESRALKYVDLDAMANLNKRPGGGLKPGPGLKKMVQLLKAVVLLLFGDPITISMTVLQAFFDN